MAEPLSNDELAQLRHDVDGHRLFSHQDIRRLLATIAAREADARRVALEEAAKVLDADANDCEVPGVRGVIQHAAGLVRALLDSAAVGT